ncbi:MAG: hypothetical protein CM15mV14_0630 [uncultured marine virus]|nr:MAG: hypothetical protein CM15mV14_0630 [uncultured marine virus]
MRSEMGISDRKKSDEKTVRNQHRKDKLKIKQMIKGK